MAKLYFRYGAMGASKTANAIMTAHNFQEQGREVLILKPSADIRWGTTQITSRAGNMSKNCIPLKSTDKIKPLLNKSFSAIIIDEAQFLTYVQVVELAEIADDFDIPVICYGLKNSAIKGQLFEGSQALLYWADSIEELKTICSCCNKKATMNLRIKHNVPVYEGEVVVIGDTKEDDDAEYYLPVCRKHYLNPNLK